MKKDVLLQTLCVSLEVTSYQSHVSIVRFLDLASQTLNQFVSPCVDKFVTSKKKKGKETILVGIVLDFTYDNSANTLDCTELASKFFREPS